MMALGLEAPPTLLACTDEVSNEGAACCTPVSLLVAHLAALLR
jgi:hypothetical protein